MNIFDLPHSKVSITSVADKFCPNVISNVISNMECVCMKIARIWHY